MGMVSSTSTTTLRTIARGRVLPDPRARGDGYAERQDPDVRILIAHLSFLIPDPPLAICLELCIMQFNHAVARELQSLRDVISSSASVAGI